jgi:hypothetical protein
MAWSVQSDAAVENKVKVWQGELFGATQALTRTVALRFVSCALTVASPELLVMADFAERVAVPPVSVKLTVTFASGTPRLRAWTVSGTAIVAP